MPFLALAAARASHDAERRASWAARFLGNRTPEGSLLSVRIPVTRANRRMLRVLRTAELEAWHEAG